MFKKLKVLKHEKRPWGIMWTIIGHDKFWLKLISVGGSTRLQSHNHRTEWHLGFYKISPKNKHRVLPGIYIKLVNGDSWDENAPYESDRRTEWHFGFYRVKPKEKHRLLRGIYLEFVHGPVVEEEDIIRYEDNYGRAFFPNPGERVVMVSGGFDPIHVGHLEMFKEAKKLGDKLIVVLNCDDWLIRKKGKYFMNQEDRATLIRDYKYVDDVFILQTSRDDVSEAIEKIKPHIFANGGDRKAEADIPEASVCIKLGVEMVFNVGPSGKMRSSSELLDEYIKKPGKTTTRGNFSWQKNV